MNTNRDSSLNTLLKRARTVSAYQAGFKAAVNAGTAISPRGVSNLDASMLVDAAFVSLVQVPPTMPSVQSYVPVLMVAYFTGTSTWTAPSTCVSPITYWMIGGGGGGGGAYDSAGAGGGGGGQIVTGTYAITQGQTYSVVVGLGGYGGQGSHAGGLTPIQGSDTINETSGAAGGASSFDASNGGPQALGGGNGNRSRLYTNTGAAATPTSASSGGNGGGAGGSGGGGGGSSGAGAGGTHGSNQPGGAGGAGTSATFAGINSGAPVVYGVGGNGATDPSLSPVTGATAAANTGNGGGGGGSPGGNQASGGAGGSGLVVISFYA